MCRNGVTVMIQEDKVCSMEGVSDIEDGSHIRTFEPKPNENWNEIEVLNLKYGGTLLLFEYSIKSEIVEINMRTK